MMEAAMLDHDEKVEALSARMTEMEQWQSGFDKEWGDHTIDHNNIEKHVEDLETDRER